MRGGWGVEDRRLSEFVVFWSWRKRSEKRYIRYVVSSLWCYCRGYVVGKDSVGGVHWGGGQ